MTQRMDRDLARSRDFLDVLEEAVLRRTGVAVILRNGEIFFDVVMDVVTREGVDRALFRNRGEVPVREIRSPPGRRHEGFSDRETAASARRRRRSPRR